MTQEIRGAMFCLLAVLIYFCGDVSKKGCQFACLVERKGNCILVNAFLYFNSKVCKRLPKKLPMGKKLQKCKKILSKSATESLNPYTVFCFVLFLQSRWWYILVCKYLTALLPLTEARLKDPRYRQNKRFLEFLYL
jgi:hypothetical protein